MRRFKLIVAVSCVLALVLLASEAFASMPTGPTGAIQTNAEGLSNMAYEPGEVIVKFKSGTSARRKGDVQSLSCSTTGSQDLGSPGEDIRLLKLRPGVSVEDAVNTLESQPDVVYAEPNYIAKAFYQPNDPFYSNEWGLNNTGQTIKGSEGKVGADIDAPEAWNIEKGQTNPVTVAVLDSGIDESHPDLDSKIGPKGYNWIGISQTDALKFYAMGHPETTQEYAQSIRGSGGNLTHVGVWLQKLGFLLDGVTVSVRSSLGGGDLASYYIPPADIPATAEGKQFYQQLSNPVSTTRGQTYYLVIRTLSNDWFNYYGVAVNIDSYYDGQGYYYSGGWVSMPSNDFYFKTNPNSDPRDDNGHGTHVAGTVAAETNNGIGVAGVSFGAKIMPLKVLGANGSGPNSGIIAAIRHAADNGADVINMSFGNPGQSQSLQDAVTYAHNKGVTLFAATGNTGDTTMNYPAGCQHVIGVGNTTNKDQRANSSTYNSSTDVSAPGKDIYSTLPTYTVTVTAEGSSKNYDYLSGTSMACPMASGLAALMLSANPSLATGELQSIMQNTATDLGGPGRDDEFGYGRINACNAVQSAQPRHTWYLAEGTTAWGFSCYVTIENPNSTAVTAQIGYMTGEGLVDGGEVIIPAASQATVNPRDTLGDKDFSTRVECKEGKTIAVDRTTTWAPSGTGAGVTGDGHCSIGVTSPATTWYLAEGSSAWGFECWLLIQNPNDAEATANVTYMIEGTDPVTVQKKIPANSRETYNMADDIGGADASIKVEADMPVIPERAMYKNNKQLGHDSIGTTAAAASYYLAEGTTAWGFTTYVLVQNPNPGDTDVTITYMTSSGAVPQAPFTMPGNSRKTIRVNDVMPDTDFSTQVTGSQPVIAERAMYWGEGTEAGEACHDSIGMSAPHTTFYLPDGQTSEGRETYTLVQNPNAGDVTVEVSYLTSDGAGNLVFEETITGNSRKTFSMVDKGISGRAAVLVTSKTTGMKIMVERAMYWNSRGAGTDTIGGYSG